MRRVAIAFALAFTSFCVPSPDARAQGRTDYFNVESPQVKPLAVARLAGHDYLLVCNTPDNSLEIWDTDESLPVASRFKGRVPVGLEPVSVAFNPTFSRAYTANFLGDSVSMIALAGGDGGVAATLVMTRHVGDEPMDVAFSADDSHVFVTHATNGTFGWRGALTLDPVPPSGGLPDMAQIDLTAAIGPGQFGIKEPRAVAVSGGRLFVLGFKGGNDPAEYDFDVYVRDLASGAVTSVSGLGSTNFNMDFETGGDFWVVGGEAQNEGNPTEPQVAAEKTGFVKSTIYFVKSSGAVVSRDLNDVDGTENPVAPALALAQPTDVAVFEPAGAPLKVFVAAMGSDRVASLTPGGAGGPYGWPIARIDVPVAPGSTNPVSGPRGLAIKYANAADPADPGARLYVLNRLDNSFAIVDPVADTHLATVALANDPTPAYVREGRRFLYSAKESGNGFVSCASCHMDARTDSLVWFLGTPGLPAQPYPPGLADGLDAPATFLADKGGMVTQSLQGLLDFEVDPANRDLFTNAPYHWRGDRADFTEFAGAFQGLLGAAAPLDPLEMKQFETFVNSVHYPPNPRQPDARAYTGALGNPDDDTSGSDARLGLKLFHITPISICAGRSCVQCHALPEGSNNRGTVPTAGGELIETAQTRGLFQREARQDKAPGAPSPVVTGEFGLTHLGLSASLNAFINRFTPATKPDGTPSFTAAGLLAIKAYMRQFDFGVAPLVGRSYTVDPANKGTSETNRTIALFENQARLGNVGVAVYARIGGAETGYWFDLTAAPAPAYREEGSAPGIFIDRASLLALPAQLRDRIVFQATPLGSERRVAALDGKPAALAGAAPSALELRPMVPNTANAQVPSLRKNWDPNAPPGLEFQWMNGAVPTPPFPKAIRLMQHGLVSDGQGQYGLTALRHEAPRRFAVAGHDILPGATLRLFVPASAVAPNPSGPLSQIPTIELVLPLHPTAQTLGDGRRVWESAVEAEPLVVYELLLGGPLAPGMPAVLDPVQVLAAAEPPAAGTFDPHGFNWHYVRVKNPDGQEGDGGWQRLRL